MDQDGDKKREFEFADPVLKEVHAHMETLKKKLWAENQRVTKKIEKLFLGTNE